MVENIENSTIDFDSGASAHTKQYILYFLFPSISSSAYKKDYYGNDNEDQDGGSDNRPKYYFPCFGHLEFLITVEH